MSEREILTYSWIGVVVILGFAGFGYADLRSDNKEARTKIAELEFNLNLSNESIYNLQTENATLTEKLMATEETAKQLEEKNERLDDKNDELKKIAETDPELLKKYSKVYFLNENYTPRKLEDINSRYTYPAGKKVPFLDDAEPFLDELLEDAHDDNIDLFVSSGYRSFAEQKSIKSNYAVTYGAGTANQFSAEQGYSEHQIGTAVDFATSENGWMLTSTFDQTRAYKWLTDNAYKYGFVLSYPKGNTYYQYEPWHWRFVGEDLARKLHKDKKNFYDLDQREIDKYIGEIFD